MACAAAYYLQTNPPVPLDSFGVANHTPTSKLIAIRLRSASPDQRIH